MALGAPSKADPNSEYIQGLMQSALAQIAMSEGAGDRLKLHKLKDCTSQVVAGTAVKCTMVVEGLSDENKHHCQVSIWDRPWLKDARETTIKCSEVDENGVRGEEKKYEFKPKVRVERDTIRA
uniref:Putative cystatin-like domain protein n=1 Tax=Xenopsylla cheopis TaxID=163159 RepID=A0A6M2DRN2_XENCH